MVKDDRIFNRCQVPDASEWGDQQPETLTPKEIQAILKIGKYTLYNLLHSGAFPVIRIGNQLRIPKKPFCKWLSEPHTY